MSCYEWEYGKFALPVTEYSKLKRAFYKEWNAWMDRQLAAMLRWWEGNKKTRQPQWKDYQGQSNYMEFYARESALQPYSLLFTNRLGNPRLTPRKPVRKDFPHIKRGQRCFIFEEASITFDDDTHTVTWDVAENNHACERARKHPMAIYLFQLLEKVKWSKKRPGGEIVGNDEYHRDSREDGGGNYVKAQFPRRKFVSSF